MKPADVPFMVCIACAKPMTDGQLAVVLDLYEELIGAEGQGEPVNLILSYTWCRACAPHYAQIQRSVLPTARAADEQDYASRGAH